MTSPVIVIMINRKGSDINRHPDLTKSGNVASPGQLFNSGMVD